MIHHPEVPYKLGSQVLFIAMLLAESPFVHPTMAQVQLPTVCAEREAVPGEDDDFIFLGVITTFDGSS